MPKDPTYALSKLSNAVYYLAIGEGDVRDRLKTAYEEFHPVSEDDFPPTLRADWRWIKGQLIRMGPVRRQDGSIRMGALDNTLSRIRNSTGAKIAKRIIKLQYDLEDHLREEKSAVRKVQSSGKKRS